MPLSAKLPVSALSMFPSAIRFFLTLSLLLQRLRLPAPARRLLVLRQPSLPCILIRRFFDLSSKRTKSCAAICWLLAPVVTQLRRLKSGLNGSVPTYEHGWSALLQPSIMALD
jgi:hypothetical protein